MPVAQEVLDEIGPAVAEEDQRKLLAGNAVRLYRLG